MTLVEFLLARIAEDQADAERAAKMRYLDPRDAPWEAARLAVRPGFPGSYGPHQARWSPARVLAECEAKRQIVQMFADQLEGFNAPYPTPEDIDEDKLWPEFGGGVIVGLRDALRLLAVPYADRPDFREEWRA